MPRPHLDIIDASRNPLDADDASIAARAWYEDLLVLDNYAVNALAGNANNPNLQTRIVEVKGGKRGEKQPVGWTRPFDYRMLAAIDLTAVENRRMQELLRDPVELTAAIGGLSFIRARADMAAKERLSIPDAIIPEGKGSAVQIYSPVGITTTERLTRMALVRGVEPVMTSANRSGTPESVTKAAGVDFMRTTPSSFAPPQAGVFFNDDSTKSLRPRGSYPILTVEADRLAISRPGCFEPAILQAALAEYQVVLHESPDLPKHPETVLRMVDLPLDIQKLQGAEFRLGLLATLGWSATN